MAPRRSYAIVGGRFSLLTVKITQLLITLLITSLADKARHR